MEISKNMHLNEKQKFDAPNKKSGAKTVLFYRRYKIYLLP
jgi:hypothetical protein